MNTPLVPSAPLPEGPATAQSHDEAEAHPGQDRRAPQAAPTGASRLRAGRLGPPGRARRQEGGDEVDLVDEVTQYEFVAAVEALSERFPVPALEALIEAFPFEVKGLHADSEYVRAGSLG